MLDMSMSALEKDIYRIKSSGNSSRLKPGQARDLREYIKVLVLISKTLRDGDSDKQEALNELSEDELKARVKAIL